MGWLRQSHQLNWESRIDSKGRKGSTFSAHHSSLLFYNGTISEQGKWVKGAMTCTHASKVYWNGTCNNEDWHFWTDFISAIKLGQVSLYFNFKTSKAIKSCLYDLLIYWLLCRKKARFFLAEGLGREVEGTFPSSYMQRVFPVLEFWQHNTSSHGRNPNQGQEEWDKAIVMSHCPVHKPGLLQKGLYIISF